ncbi:MAG: type II secretion system F family protein [Gammaproteobacteria bacterium]
MPHFSYSGRDSSGALVTGSLDAGTADDVASKLFGDRVTPIEIKELPRKQLRDAGRTRVKKGETSGSGQGLIRNLFSRNKIEIDELIMFSRQMFSLTKAGLPLDRAIKGLMASMNNLQLRAILQNVVASLENGMTLSSSFAQHPKVFSQLYLSLVHVGETTGQLDLAFKEIGKYLQLEKNTAKQVKAATRYPTFVIVAMVAALLILAVFVIPVFSSVFDRLGADLPWQTVVLIRVSDFILGYWPLLLAAAGGAVFGFLSWVRTESGELSWDKRKLNMPLAGPVFEKVALGRFARTFSMVLAAGVPIVQGLTVVAGAVGNAFIARNVMNMREGVERGESIYHTASSSHMFSPLVLQMISVGEETGTVDNLLAEVADFYDAEVEYDIKQLSDAIEPILITFIAGLVLILALGVFLPIWDLSTAVNN